MGTPPISGHRILAHTADLIVEAWAPSRVDCLAQAVAALTESYADTAGAGAGRRYDFRLAARTDEQALHQVLEEAIYVLDALGGVVLDTHLAEGSPTGLSGWFLLADADRVRLVGSVPKGVSLSGLVLRREDGGWRCTATVDV